MMWIIFARKILILPNYTKEKAENEIRLNLTKNIDALQNNHFEVIEA